MEESLHARLRERARMRVRAVDAASRVERACTARYTCCAIPSSPELRRTR